MRILLSLTWIALALLMTTMAHAENHASQLMIAVKLTSVATHGAGEKVLANPSMAVTPGREFRYRVGGVLSPTHGGEELETGTQIHGIVEPTGNGTHRVKLTISLGNLVANSNDDADIVLTETLQIRTKVSLQGKQRIQYSDNQWCEISMERLPETVGDALIRDCGSCGIVKPTLLR